MKKWKYLAYRAALALMPAGGGARINASAGMDAALSRDIAAILRKNRAVGATVALFNEEGVTGVLAYGEARRGLPAAESTVYRTASIAKLVTAMAVFRLGEACDINLDADADAFLPCSIRHPQAPDTSVTLRMLMSHTAGIHDGKAYENAKQMGDVPLSRVMAGDSHTPHLPGAGFEYSNLGAGIIACALEGMLHKPFEAIMRETLFDPLAVQATFYPQLAQGELADCRRMLPPAQKPLLDARARAKREARPFQIDPERHYLLSQGNLWITAPQLAHLGVALLKPRYQPMRRPVIAFGARDRSLSEGTGMFILSDKNISPHTVYGHQGLAYGAVHGLFFDPQNKRGFALLTSGCSVARRQVMADINLDLIRRCCNGR